MKPPTHHGSKVSFAYTQMAEADKEDQKIVPVDGSPKESVRPALTDPAKLLRVRNTALSDAGESNLQKINDGLTKVLAGETFFSNLPLLTRKEGLISKYKIYPLGESQVELNLPKGTNVIMFLNEVQVLVSRLYGRGAINESRLKTWSSEMAFTLNQEEDRELRIDGNVAGSTCKSRGEQESRGWNDVDLAHLAAAHAAYFLATGKDLFNANVVRARGGALYFDDDGLHVLDYTDDIRIGNVAASSAITFSNQKS